MIISNNKTSLHIHSHNKSNNVGQLETVFGGSHAKCECGIQNTQQNTFPFKHIASLQKSDQISNTLTSRSNETMQQDCGLIGQLRFSASPADHVDLTSSRENKNTVSCCLFNCGHVAKLTCQLPSITDESCFDLCRHQLYGFHVSTGQREASGNHYEQKEGSVGNCQHGHRTWSQRRTDQTHRKH